VTDAPKTEEPRGASDLVAKPGEPARSTPLLAQVLLIVGFVLLALVGVVTVVVPEVTDDGEDEEATATEADRAGREAVPAAAAPSPAP
jgi:hypothetical protein